MSAPSSRRNREIACAEEENPVQVWQSERNGARESGIRVLQYGDRGPKLHRPPLVGSPQNWDGCSQHEWAKKTLTTTRRSPFVGKRYRNEAGAPVDREQGPLSASTSFSGVPGRIMGGCLTTDGARETPRTMISGSPPPGQQRQLGQRGVWLTRVPIPVPMHYEVGAAEIAASSMGLQVVPNHHARRRHHAAWLRVTRSLRCPLRRVQASLQASKAFTPCPRALRSQLV